ncbi:MAG: C69 family dipeptidase [Candidatus Marinimicrobia bacterium]|nr:C69 family dipeptidase [Candidatus Neomarinimicrobiota bacterium]
MKFLKTFLLILLSTYCFAEKDDWVGGYPDGCTSIMVGQKASADGSVMTSHTCDSHRTRAWFDMIAARKYKPGAESTMYKRENDDSHAMPTYKYTEVGKIPQVKETYGYINTAYPCMNEKQLAIGESTFGGRESLREPDKGLIDCQQLVRLMLERCATAREAIKMADDLTQKYGYNDYGETLTIADKKEVWFLEILGPGKGQIGALWAARRIPDDHVSVTANGSRLRMIDLQDTVNFMASDNLHQVALDSGWWDPSQGEFEFCYAYSPESRTSFATRRREWRVLSLLAPSLNLNPESENYPFSVKPDSLVNLAMMTEIFRDYYQETPYDLTAMLTQVDEKGETIISPFANPFMPYDMNKLFRINGGWGWRGERQIARWYTMYATITQSRDFLPDEIGGITWIALDNVATSVYVPVWCSVLDVAKPYKTPGRRNGFTRESAWWGFNRLSTLTAQRFRDIYPEVLAELDSLQMKIYGEQKSIEDEALSFFAKSPKKARNFLTDYTVQQGNFIHEKVWKMGDRIWTRWDEKF